MQSGTESGIINSIRNSGGRTTTHRSGGDLSSMAIQSDIARVGHIVRSALMGAGKATSARASTVHETQGSDEVVEGEETVEGTDERV